MFCLTTYIAYANSFRLIRYTVHTTCMIHIVRFLTFLPILPSFSILLILVLSIRENHFRFSHSLFPFSILAVFAFGSILGSCDLPLFDFYWFTYIVIFFFCIEFLVVAWCTLDGSLLSSTLARFFFREFHPNNIRIRIHIRVVYTKLCIIQFR